MAEARRYREEEIREIFDRAARERLPDGSAPDPPEGLTLQELQEIGAEVGLSKERIAEAATSVDLRRDASPRRTSLGMPISVERVIPLPRAPTDREWDLLVTEFRRTFDARGRVGGAGSVRHWNNGNLHAYVEPTPNGFRLRMSTLKGTARPRALMGLSALGLAALLSVILILDGGVGRELIGPLMFALMGAGALGSNLVGLPSWAREREWQMEHIGTAALAMLGSEAENVPETGEPRPS